MHYCAKNKNCFVVALKVYVHQNVRIVEMVGSKYDWHSV